jgi:AraC family transcriptional regulator, positive regulator of tynA and feaB
MTQIDTLRSSSAAPTLDLLTVAEDQRAVAWRQSVRTHFPGLTASDLDQCPAAGSMRGRRFGPGRLWVILSPTLKATYSPGNEAVDPASSAVTLMMQLQGTTLVAQEGRECRLMHREICFIDEIAPFELTVSDEPSRFMLLQIPRSTVLSRYPYFKGRTAIPFDRDDAGATLLSNVLASVLESAATLEDDQCTATVAAVTQLLGAPKAPRPELADEVGWRVRVALSYIDASLGDRSLSASSVAHAQGISRRHLDQILLRATGASASQQIWLQRLARAASDLRDPRHAFKSITQIAYDLGFEDTAHFSRAFKRRHGCTPSAWRRGHAVLDRRLN